MGIIAVHTKPKTLDYSFQPFVSILVPTFNEENVIAERIENLLTLNYPLEKNEIIIVDSNSNDKTVSIAKHTIQNLPLSHPSILIIEETQRQGKASAINFGKKHAKGDYILVTDANAIFDQNVLKEIMPHFKDPGVGAVGGRYCVANLENQLAASTSFYWDLEYMMRIGESALDSACLFHGEINAWRKDIVDADIQMLSEDFDMCITIRSKGYKVVYEPRAIVYEPAATTSEDQIKQRKRTSIGTIQSLIKHRKFLIFSRNWYGKLILPSHKGLVMISPFMLLAIPLLYFLITDINIIFMHIIFMAIFFVGCCVLLFHARSRLLQKNARTTSFSSISLLKIANYVLLNEYLILLAWKDYLFGRYSVLWEKAITTR